MIETSTAKVIGLGQCSLDILGQVDHYPSLDQKAELSALLVQGGGPVATALVTLARLGIPVAMVGAVGDDDFGQQIRQGLIAEVVDCAQLLQSPKTTSQVAFISVDQKGHRNIFWHRGSASPLLPDSFAAQLAAGVRILHLDGLHLEPSVVAAKIARSLNVVTVLDAGTLRPGMERLLPLIDHLVVSEKFACQFMQSNDLDSALRALLARGARAVTITRGAAGSLTLDAQGQSFQQPAFPVKVVDTTGCGDVFHGGYIYGLLQGWPLAQTVRFAAACAALKTRQLGGRSAIPSLAEVYALLAAQGDMGSAGC